MKTEEHMGQHQDCRVCRRQPQNHADATCKLCFCPEGLSPFVRVGKQKVRHQDCARAWTTEDHKKGLKHMAELQIGLYEAAMSSLDTAIAENEQEQGKLAERAA